MEGAQSTVELEGMQVASGPLSSTTPDQTPPPQEESVLQGLSSTGNARVAAMYVFSSTKRNSRGCLIGLFTVLIVVTFVFLLQNVIQKTPIVFMKLGENSVGEFDATLSAKAVGNVTRAFFVNYTEVEQRLAQHATLVKASAPRWTLLGNFYPVSEHTYVDGRLLGSSAILLAIDSEREIQGGIGREWKYPPLNFSEVYLSNPILSRLNLTLDSNVTMVLDFMELASNFGLGNIKDLLLSYVDNATFGIPLAGNLSFQIPLPFKIPFTWVNYTAKTIAVTIPQLATIDVAQIEATYDIVAGALSSLGFNVTPWNQTDLAAVLPANATIPLGGMTFDVNIADLIPPGIDLTQDGELWVVITYDYATTVNQTIDQIIKAFIVNETLTVKGGIGDPSGKFATALGNVAILESKYAEYLVNRGIETAYKPLQIAAKNISTALQDFLTRVNSTVASLGILSGNLNITLLGDIENALAQAIKELDALKNLTNITIRIDDYAMSVVLQMKDRQNIYMQGSSGLEKSIIKFTNDVALALGVGFPVSYDTPVKDSISSYSFFRLFLDQIFNMTLVVMLFLGGMLIYSLLLSDVEAKTYEYGMLRALGMPNFVLVELLGFQALIFAVPGITLGILFGWIIYVPIADYIAYFVALKIDLSIANSAIILAIVIGVIMPTIANVVPIKRALTNTLRDALDIYHSVTTEVSVRIQKLESVGISPLMLSLSLLIIIFGFLTYYMIPYAFTYGNYSLFFTILIAILLAFLFGLSLIGQVIHPWLELLLLTLISLGFPKSRVSVKEIVKKNLSAHARRNSKTAIMLTTSFAFIIFAGAVFTLLGNSLSEYSQLAAAADVAALAAKIGTPLPETSLTAFLDSEIASGKSIAVSYTFMTFPMDDYPFVQYARISNLVEFPDDSCNIYGLQSNYLSSTFERFFSASEIFSRFTYPKTPLGNPDVVKTLYTEAGNQTLPIETSGIIIPPDVCSSYNTSQDSSTYVSTEEAYHNYFDVLISEALRDEAAVDTSTPLYLRIRFKRGNSSTADAGFLAKARAMVDRMEGFFFSSYRSMAWGAPVIMSMDQFQKLLVRLHKEANSTYSLPSRPAKQRLLIKVRESATQSQRAAFADSVKNYIPDDLSQVFEVKGIVASVTDALDILNVFFLTVAAISGFLCFFVLWLSFSANVSENSWEFAVLRSIGLTANRVILLFVIEAVCLVLSSVIIGSVIGFAVAIVLTIQFNLFTQLPFTFSFPYTLWFPVVGMSFLIATAGSYIPASIIRRRAIGTVLKSTQWKSPAT